MLSGLNLIDCKCRLNPLNGCKKLDMVRRRDTHIHSCVPTYKSANVSNKLVSFHYLVLDNFLIITFKTTRNLCFLYRTILKFYFDFHDVHVFICPKKIGQENFHG